MRRSEVDASGTRVEDSLDVRRDLFGASGKCKTVENVVGDQRACTLIVAGGDERADARDELRVQRDGRVELCDHGEIHRDLTSRNAAGPVAVLVDDCDRPENDPDIRVTDPFADDGTTSGFALPPTFNSCASSPANAESRGAHVPTRRGTLAEDGEPQALSLAVARTCGR